MFDDIRPYQDTEVQQIAESLLNEREFLNSVAAISLPTMYKFWPGGARYIVKKSMTAKAAKLQTIKSIQLLVSGYLTKLIKTTITELTYSGIEHLDKNKPTLFISNHRDIVLDVALINHVLHENGMETVEAAVGDNLLSKRWVEDLMRLNKSFIVKRSEKNKRAMLMASKQLSAYIHHSLVEKQHNIWIAQKEGRAKDGVDKTNAALISMLLLNKPKETPISQYLSTLNIVPVAISYEFDPCDQDKARELAQKAVSGHYQKEEHEDLKSITLGLMGQKGRVNLTFCPPLTGEFNDSKEIAESIDQQIIANYKLYPSNNNAYEYLQAGDNKLIQIFSERTQTLTDEQRHWLLTMYANPVISKKQLQQLR
ncbi:1-acyl-sn-glycerol-3-phosphate acyltransferase [Thalassotalea marina]|uniref:Acyltransferase n=1 Tax=Thalassotalea marina TaxID=1673741 RepID=A0A919BQ78_9GAMM|nr:1-acyl-sn-glycerol-3-phosphate acyltransferase [Thalassotalea marina]GHG02589.1 acyltransferase [Thalassotalea marina]